MRKSLAIAVLCAFVTGGIGIAAFAQDGDKKEKEKSEKQLEKERKKELDRQAKEKLKEFSEARKEAKTENDFISALEDLGTMQHEKILREITKYLGAPQPGIRKEAARQIAKYKKDMKAASILLSSARGEKEDDVRGHYLSCIGTIGARASARELTSFFRDKSGDVALCAVDACGTLGSKDAIMPLIRLLRDLEAIEDDPMKRGYGGGYPPGGGQQPPPGGQQPVPQGYSPAEDEQIKRKRKLLSPVRTALADITGERYLKAVEWEKWWKKNSKKFKESEE
ncbi:MAG: HEAT repeat domain-containing protein [Planctomycetota bacterium]|jgi:hypothetical protein